MVVCDKFPSPGGDYGLSDPPTPISRNGSSSVSVPWRGLRSFGPSAARRQSLRDCKFPSPGGDYGLSDQADLVFVREIYKFPSPGGDYGLSDRILCHHHMYGFLIRFQHTRRLYVGVAREPLKYIPKSCHPGVLCHVRHRLLSMRYHCILLGPFVKSQTSLPHALFPSAHVRSPLMRHSMEPSWSSGRQVPSPATTIPCR